MKIIGAHHSIAMRKIDGPAVVVAEPNITVLSRDEDAGWEMLSVVVRYGFEDDDEAEE